MKPTKSAFSLIVLLCLTISFFVPSMGVSAPLGYMTQDAPPATPLGNIRLLSSSGTATVKGYFANSSGVQVGDSFTGTVGTVTAKSFPSIANVLLAPTGSAGVVVTYLSAGVYVDAKGTGTDFATNPTNYPYVEAGTRVIPFGRVGVPFSDSTVPGGTQTVTVVPGTSGGLSIYRSIDLSTTGLVVKSTPGQLYSGTYANASSSFRFVKFYNKATAASSADTPVATIPLPPYSSVPVTITQGWAFSTGISIRASTGVADADNTAPSANDVVVSLGYK